MLNMDVRTLSKSVEMLNELSSMDSSTFEWNKLGTINRELRHYIQRGLKATGFRLDYDYDYGEYVVARR